MEFMKKFSILCPTQLSRKYILESIESVREQSYPNWELIIKADESTADLSLLQGLDLKNITIILNKDSGITDAMNQMMRFSTGDVMMWMNDDDKLLPHTLQTVSESIGEFEWGFGEMLTDRGVMGRDCNLVDLRAGNCICQPTVFWTREAYKYVGEMSTKHDLVSDYEYWIRLMRAFTPKFINKPIAYYRFHPDQITSKMTSEQLRQAREVMNEI